MRMLHICFLTAFSFPTPHCLLYNRDTAMAKTAAGSANDVTRFLSMEAGPSSPTSVFSASSQADWAAKRLVWVPSEKHGFEVRGHVWGIPKQGHSQQAPDVKIPVPACFFFFYTWNAMLYIWFCFQPKSSG